jgi:endonuclease/exonuclease/phosphatase family metal-dependent hydrolase
MRIRTWNLFHGNTVPAGKQAYLDDMLERTRADDLDVLCAQEVPAWALDRFTCSCLSARPAIGPYPITRALGRRITGLNHGLLRSAFSGQGNAIMLADRHKLLSTADLVLNPRRFRDDQALALGLGAQPRLAWGHERRVVHAARFRSSDGRTYLVANAHCTSYAANDRLAEVELLRAAWFARSTAAAADVVVLAGDFNLTSRSAVLRSLTEDDWGFSALGPGIDHVLVHGALASPPRPLPDDWRRRGDVLLSDHAPVEVDVE